MKSKARVFVSAGEASGDAYGAALIRALRARVPGAVFTGLGGVEMEAAGQQRVVRAEDVAVMGVTEILRHVPRIYASYRKLVRSIKQQRPDVAVLIDFPDIHFKLAEEFHRLGVPVIFFVSPQLWAWKKHRIKLVQKYVTRMLVIFPFEEAFYRERGVEAEFVGHPLAELPLPKMSRERYGAEIGLDPEKTWIALLPGSRPKEIRDNLPEMLEAAWGLVEHVSTNWRDYRFLIPLAPTLNGVQRAAVREMVERRGFGLPIRLVEDARAALFHARMSVVASGTATVEAALMGNPFVVVYRVSPVTYAIAKRVVTVPHVAMANLIADKRVVPELIQDDFTAANIVQQVERLLPDGLARESMKKELRAIGVLLRSRKAGSAQEGMGAIERVAEITLELLDASADPALNGAG